MVTDLRVPLLHIPSCTIQPIWEGILESWHKPLHLRSVASSLVLLVESPLLHFCRAVLRVLAYCTACRTPWCKLPWRKHTCQGGPAGVLFPPAHPQFIWKPRELWRSCPAPWIILVIAFIPGTGVDQCVRFKGRRGGGRIKPVKPDHLQVHVLHVRDTMSVLGLLVNHHDQHR